jgi:ribosome maturation factor RimP
MAIQLDAIRAVAVRVAASHHLEVVDVEFSGGGKHRALRVFLEKDAEERARLKAAAEKGEAEGLPAGVPVEMLSGVTHEDCAQFATDFGTLLDVEDLIPGAEYTLEVSSPGLERKLYKAEDYGRFLGSLVKVQTFSAIEGSGPRAQGPEGKGPGSRHWQGRLVKFEDGRIVLDLSAVKQKGKGKKAAGEAQTVEIALGNVEKANLVAEI